MKKAKPDLWMTVTGMVLLATTMSCQHVGQEEVNKQENGPATSRTSSALVNDITVLADIKKKFEIRIPLNFRDSEEEEQAFILFAQHGWADTFHDIAQLAKSLANSNTIVYTPDLGWVNTWLAIAPLIIKVENIATDAIAKSSESRSLNFK